MFVQKLATRDKRDTGAVVNTDDPLAIHAKAVVDAAGGFGANNDLVSKYVPRLKGFATTNHPGATGDGLVLAEKAGAQLIDMTEIQTHPTVVPKVGEMITEAVRGNGAVLINKDGSRFYNELNTRDAVSAAILKQNIVLALGIKALFLAITLTGQATMWMAVFADMGVSLLVVFNGLRLLKK